MKKLQRVLVIEDVPGHAHFFTNDIKGCEIVLVASYEEAKRAIQGKRKIHCAIIDLHIPKFKNSEDISTKWGVEVVKLALDRLNSERIMIVSSHREDSFVEDELRRLNIRNRAFSKPIPGKIFDEQIQLMLKA
jgi:hypothetical protein